MEYGRAITFPLKDPSWLSKIAVGSLIGLVPFLNLAQAGYGLEVTRRVAGGERDELPRWDQLGRYFSTGLGVATGSLLWSLPVVLLVILLFTWGLGDLAVVGALSEGGTVEVGAGLGGAFLFTAFLTFLLAALISLTFPVAMLRYATTQRWIAMFDFGWIAGYLGRNLSVYAVMLVVLGLLGLAAGLVLTVLQLIPVVGFLAALPGAFWMALVVNHLLGQLARQTA